MLLFFNFASLFLSLFATSPKDNAMSCQELGLARQNLPPPPQLVWCASLSFPPSKALFPPGGRICEKGHGRKLRCSLGSAIKWFDFGSAQSPTGTAIPKCFARTPRRKAAQKGNR